GYPSRTDLAPIAHLNFSQSVMATTLAVGIDLGTTFSAVATLDPSGRSTMLRSLDGEILTPSVVLFNQDEVVVGKDARNATLVDPSLVAEWVKRDMGSPYYSRPIRGQYLPPEVIQACILRKLRDDISRAVGHDDYQCVITVPAYFDEPRRKATADAGEMAGLKVLDIVNEPTAAALAFGESLGYLAPGGDVQREMTVMIYDLGGGTFDCTLLRLAPGDIRTLATDGDVQLGGHDWDLRLLEHVAAEFEKQHQSNFRDQPAVVARVLNQVIEAKHTLSARTRANVRVDYAGRSAEVAITRERFEDLTADLLERTSYTTRQLNTAAGLEWKDVDRLLLVGGSTRMLMVREMLKRLSGIEPDRTVNPDEAVARGAAIYAGYLLGKRGLGAKFAFEVTNVNAHSLGVEGIDPETLRKKNVVLIPRNSPLPAKATERFMTKSDGQQSIVVQVLEGESATPGECSAIGRTVLRDLPENLPKGWPIEVTFEYATNGRLSVTASVSGTERAAQLELERARGLSSAGVDRWKKPIQEAAGFDAFESMMDEVLGLDEHDDDAMPAYVTPASPVSMGAAATIDVRRQPAAYGDTSPGVAATPAPRAPASSAASAPVSPMYSPAALARKRAVAGGDEATTESPTSGRQPTAHRGEPGAGYGTGGRSGASQAVPRAEAVRPAPRESASENGEDSQDVRGWVLAVAGYITSAAVGLGLGYLVLSRLRPDVFPWPF
ncbi:MAG: Hsp70 family protein, partial [Planctomycetota bacterium]